MAANTEIAQADIAGIEEAPARQSHKSRPGKSRRANGASRGSVLELPVLLQALQAVRNGDFSARLPSDLAGLSGKVADTFNEIVIANERLARELERAGQIVGKDGRTRH